MVQGDLPGQPHSSQYAPKPNELAEPGSSDSAYTPPSPKHSGGENSREVQCNDPRVRGMLSASKQVVQEEPSGATSGNIAAARRMSTTVIRNVSNLLGASGGGQDTDPSLGDEFQLFVAGETGENVSLSNGEKTRAHVLASFGENHHLVVAAGGAEVLARGAPASHESVASASAFSIVARSSDAALKSQAVVSIGAGDAHSALVTRGGQLLTWGSDANYQLGHQPLPKLSGKRVELPPPLVGNQAIKRVEGKHILGERIVAVACSAYSTFALSERGQVFSFGEHDLLARDLTLDVEALPCEPAVIRHALDGAFISQIDAGAKHVWCLTASGRVYGWGDEARGQLGRGAQPSHAWFPTLLNLPERIRLISCGRSAGCALGAESGAAYLTTASGLVKLEFPPGVSVEQMSCGPTHTSFLAQDGQWFFVSHTHKTLVKGAAPASGVVIATHAVKRGETVLVVASDLSSASRRKERLIRSRPSIQVCSCEILERLSLRASFVKSVIDLKGALAEIYGYPTCLGGSFLESSKSTVHARMIPELGIGVAPKKAATPASVSNNATKTLSPRHQHLLGVKSGSATNLKIAGISGSDLDVVGMLQSMEAALSALDKSTAAMKWLRQTLERLHTLLVGVAPFAHDVDQIRPFYAALLNPATTSATNEGVPPAHFGILIHALSLLPVASRKLLISWAVADFTADEIRSRLVVPILGMLDGACARKDWTLEGGAQRCMNILIELRAQCKGSIPDSEFCTTQPNNWNTQTIIDEWTKFTQHEALRKRKEREVESAKSRPPPSSIQTIEDGVQVISQASPPISVQYAVAKACAAAEENVDFFSIFSTPFAVSALVKRNVMQIEVQHSQMRHAMMSAAIRVNPFFELHVRRDNLLEDTVNVLLRAHRAHLALPLKVIFAGEPGLDWGGVRKEFFDLLAKELFNPTTSDTFIVADPLTRVLWFNRKGASAKSVALDDAARLAGELVMSDQIELSGDGGPMFSPTAHSCPGHGEAGLVAFETTNSEFTCDVCHESQPKGKQIRGCRTCDYDVCPACFDALTASLAAREARVLAEAQDAFGNKVVSNAAREMELLKNRKAARRIQLIGTLIGIAISNSVMLDVHLPHFVYETLMRGQFPVRPTLDHLAQFDPALANGLRQTLEYDGDDFDDLFGHETFAVDGVELMPGGSEVSLTKQNRVEYVAARVKYEVVDSVAPILRALCRGFSAVFDDESEAMKLFNANEFELMLCGVPDLDIDALRRSARYEGGYTPASKVVGWFWELLQEEFTPEMQEDFLAFTTGSHRAPVGGLGKLTIIIQRMGPDSENLPTASTCFDTFLLPEYKTKAKMKEKIKLALTFSQGFGLQ